MRIWVGEMADAFLGAGALDYSLCRYGASKLQFRGPCRDLAAPYVAVLGGTETFGKFVPDPYPALMQAMTGVTTLNLGCMNAGPDAYLGDPGVMAVAGAAQIGVVQVMGAQNLTNRYYSVHPRRNDRFLAASPLLQALFPEVDFTDFHFTRHMLRTLQAISANRFEVLAEELRAAWVDRMIRLLTGLRGRTVLLWLADHLPMAPGAADLARGPVLVDAEMMAVVGAHATMRVDAVFDPALRESDLAAMAFAPLEVAIAATLPGPSAHRAAARKLSAALQQLI
jgi:Domain of unknown function (DUF6473)